MYRIGYQYGFKKIKQPHLETMNNTTKSTFAISVRFIPFAERLRI